MKNDYIMKLERVLKFVSTFDTDEYTQSNPSYVTQNNKGTHYNVCSTESSSIIITIPTYDESARLLSYLSSNLKLESVVRVWSKSLPKRNLHPDTILPSSVVLDDSYYTDNYYSQFMLYNCNSTEVKFTDSPEKCTVPMPDLDLMTEDGMFQYSLLHSDLICDIMQIMQYFYNKGHHSFSDWMHEEFDSIYTAIEDRYGFE